MSSSAIANLGTFPFYSPHVRQALHEIISNAAPPSSTSSACAETSAVTSKLASTSLRSNDVSFSRGQQYLRPGTVVRGKWTGGYSSSSDDDANHDSDQDYQSVSSSSSHSSSSQLTLGAVKEEEHPSDSSDDYEDIEDELNNKKQQQQRGKSHPKSKKSNPKNKSKNKRSKQDIVQKLGTPPSILLPLSTNNNSAHHNQQQRALLKQYALQIPNTLLPPGYLRENPNYDVPAVAKYLLDQWDVFAGNKDAKNSLPPSSSSSSPTIIVVLLQSGRFAGAVFTLPNNSNGTTTNNKHNINNTSLKLQSHKTSTRYTIRKGQGGSQSSHDQSKNKANSIGAQLRREGEKQLRVDVTETWKEWKQCGYIRDAVLIYVSCPKGMKRDYLFGGGMEDHASTSSSSAALVAKGDGRLRNIPLDVGKPTLDAAVAVAECVLSCSVRELTEEEAKVVLEDSNSITRNGEGKEMKALKNEAAVAGAQENNAKRKNQQKSEEEKKTEKDKTILEPALPFTPLHDAVIAGDLSRVTELLALLKENGELDYFETRNASDSSLLSPSEGYIYGIDTQGGPELQTPLHLAASSEHTDAPSILNVLLIQGHANPCTIDSRGRPPYFLASSDKIRETFRLARSTLGEEYCPWDEQAKVGPPLTHDDIKQKKQKALEKKRKQRARQKEKKGQEKEAAEEEAEKHRLEEEKKKQEEDAKRIRAGLKPKTSGASNVCDFCQTVVKGKRRSQMFQRLEFVYCTTECVKKHQRELMAAAAAARMGT